jgi:hypothetical protein
LPTEHPEIDPEIFSAAQRLCAGYFYNLSGYVHRQVHPAKGVGAKNAKQRDMDCENTPPGGRRPPFGLRANRRSSHVFAKSFAGQAGRHLQETFRLCDLEPSWQVILFNLRMEYFPVSFALQRRDKTAAKRKERLFVRESDELVHGQAAGADETSQGAFGNFAMVGNR